MKEKIIIGILGAGATAIAAGCAWLAHKVHKLTTKVGATMNEVIDAETNEITDKLLEQCVQKAADKKVKAYAQDAAIESLGIVRTEIRKQVEKAVSDAYTELRQDVEDKISEEVSKINAEDMKRRVQAAAEKKVLEKFDGDVDGILSDLKDRTKSITKQFTENLASIKELYDGVSSAIAPRKTDSDKEIRLSVG